MKQSTYFRFRNLVSFLFLVVAIALPIVIIKIYEYELDFFDKLQVWLLADGVVVLFQTIVMRYIVTIPLFPDEPPQQNNRGQNG